MIMSQKLKTFSLPGGATVAIYSPRLNQKQSCNVCCDFMGSIMLSLSGHLLLASVFRFFADILNDVAIFLEILAPHFTLYFTLIVCVAGLCKVHVHPIVTPLTTSSFSYSTKLEFASTQ